VVVNDRDRPDVRSDASIKTASRLSVWSSSTRPGSRDLDKIWDRTVIMDNLGGHKAKAVRQLIRIAGTFASLTPSSSF
jgi:hypothetical protein